MERLSKPTFRILLIVLISVGLTSAYAINITLGGTVDITQILNMMGNRITNVGAPVSNSDVATKEYVDSSAATDTLASLGCSENQIPRFDGIEWSCKTIQVITNLTTLVDSSGNVGSYTSIAIGTDGNPVISYYDVTNGDLKVQKCGNPSCSAGNITTIGDSSGNVGWYTSIVIGTDGNPVISYYDVTNPGLNVTKCGNSSCSHGNIITTVDSADNVGPYTSIAIGTDGNPVISYRDVTNTGLKVAIFGNTVIFS